MIGTTIVIPVRGLYHGKSRLSPVLNTDQRSRIVAAMARHVLQVVLESWPDARVIVVTRDRETAWLDSHRDPRIEIVHQPEHSWGLNAALECGRTAARATALERLLVLSADLPLLEASDLETLLDQAAGITLATDKTGAGTNALLLSEASAIERFPFHFGEGSRRLHEEAALELGLTVTTTSRSGLQLDLDTPEDWDNLPVPTRSRLLAAAVDRTMILETA